MAAAATMVGRFPSHAPEAAWFRHLPAELRWYLWRGERQWATRTVNHGITNIIKHLTEDQARGYAKPSATYAHYTIPTLVYRDSEGDEWTEA